MYYLMMDGIFLITNGRSQHVWNDYLLCKWKTLQHHETVTLVLKWKV